MVVYGFGEKKTPESFISACDKFIYTEILKQEPQAEDKDESENTELKKLVIAAVEAQSKENGWASLSGVGGYINKNNPSFDPRNYGYSKFGKLIKSLKYLDFEERPVKDDLKNTQIYVRVRVLGKVKAGSKAAGKVR